MGGKAIITPEMKAERKRRAEELKKSTWIITDRNGAEYEVTFGQLCAFYGIKYSSMYKRVVESGKDITTALHECQNTPHCWGATYSDGTLAKGVWGDEMKLLLKERKGN